MWSVRTWFRPGLYSASRIASMVLLTAASDRLMELPLLRSFGAFRPRRELLLQHQLHAIALLPIGREVQLRRSVVYDLGQLDLDQIESHIA